MAGEAQRARARIGREQSRARIVAAATELIRERGYAALSVGEVMERAEIGRTLFYRHFDDLGDLLLKASAEAIEALYATEADISRERDPSSPDDLVTAAIAPAVAAYRRHGPLLAALAEAAPADPRIAAAQERIRARFDDLVAGVLGALPGYAGRGQEAIAELARALNLLNTSYLLDAFGHEPRISEERALETLSTVWSAVISRGS